jgi:hypothetical protein
VAALATTWHVKMITTCAPAGYYLSWDGGSIPAAPTPYLQAIWSAAGALGVGFPPEAEQNTPGRERLTSWFHAQSLIKSGQPASSVAYFRHAQAAQLLVASGHDMGTRGETSCQLFNWLLANTITDIPPPGGFPEAEVTAWATSLISSGSAQDVVEAYQLALAYQPSRADWQLMLARASAAITK